MSDTYSLEEQPPLTPIEIIKEGLIMLVVSSLAVGVLSVFHSYRYMIGL